MRALAALLLLALAPAAHALTPAGREFLEVARQLETLHCERRKLRREIVLADVERRDADARAARKRFAALGRDAESARLERRLAELLQRISDGKGGVRDPDDLREISLQQREAFYRCE